MSASIDVLHVITTFDRGGAETHLLELATAQHRRGLTVGIAWVRGRGYWSEEARNQGIQCWPLSSHSDLAREEPFPGPAAIVRLVQLLRTLRPVLIHAHLQPAELYLDFARRLAASTSPLVVTRHNTDPFWPGRPRLARWLARRVGARADHVIAISDAAARYARDEGLPEKVPVAVVRYGIDPAPFASVAGDARDALRRESGINLNTVVLLALARMVEQKSLDTLLDAFALATADAGPAKFALLLAGTGPLEQQLRSQATRLNLGDAVRFLGFRTDVPALLAASDVTVLPSAAEGFGRVLLESMAAGRPMIATAVDGIAEIVRDGENGLLVPPRDPRALADAIIAIGDRRVRERLAAGSRADLRRYTVDAMVNQTLRVYDAVTRPPVTG